MGEKNGTLAGDIATLITEGYDYSVATRMTGRAGSYAPMGGKGNAFEIMYMDKKNLENCFKPGNVKTKLTKSSTATQADLVTMKDGKILERFQCKDKTSASGVNGLVKQAKGNKYRATKLVGTTECAAAYNAKAASKGVSKVMIDSGISTKDTTRIANKFNGIPSTTGMANIVKSSTQAGAIFGGISAGIDSIANGDDLPDAAGNIVTEAAKGALIAGTSTLAGEIAMTALAVMAPVPLPVKVGIGLLSGTVFASAVSECTDEFFCGVKDVLSDTFMEIEGFYINFGI